MSPWFFKILSRSKIRWATDMAGLALAASSVLCTARKEIMALGAFPVFSTSKLRCVNNEIADGSHGAIPEDTRHV